MINRPQQLILRNPQSVRFGFIAPIVIGLTLLIAAAVFILGNANPAGLVLVLGLGGIVLGIIFAMAAVSKGKRSTEMKAIELFFAGDIWAHWQFNPGELAPAFRSTRPSAPFQVWLGAHGMYHEREGFTLMRKVLAVNYRENFEVKVRVWGGTVGGDHGGMESQEFKQAMETSTVGDASTPKIEFKLKSPLDRNPYLIYVPVPRGREQEANLLVQRYQQEVVQ